MLRVLAYEVRIVEKASRKLPQDHVAETEELAASVQKVRHGVSEGLGHVDEGAGLHVEHVLYPAAHGAVEDGQPAGLKKIEAVLAVAIRIDGTSLWDVPPSLQGAEGPPTFR